MLVDTMVACTMAFAERQISREQPPGSLGLQIQRMLRDAGISTEQLSSGESSYHQQRLTAWLHDKVSSLESMKKMRISVT